LTSDEMVDRILVVGHPLWENLPPNPTSSHLSTDIHRCLLNDLFSRTPGIVSRHQKGKPVSILIKQKAAGSAGIIANATPSALSPLKSRWV